jgi:hypothetical protein
MKDAKQLSSAPPVFNQHCWSKFQKKYRLCSKTIVFHMSKHILALGEKT